MPATNLSFAKIAATPTATAWSQAYNSGSLFISLALTTEDEKQQGELPSLGKNILGLLESEIYALSEKNIASIKTVITTSTQDLPETVQISLSLCFVKDDTLYAFVLGTGTILLKRRERVGPILQINDHQDTPSGGSGYLETNDLVLIQTSQFTKTVSQEEVSKALEYGLPNDIAETISPQVHGEKEGGAALIILSYKGVSRSLASEEEEILAAEEERTETRAQPEPKEEEPLSSSIPVPVQNVPRSDSPPKSAVEEGEPTTSPYEKATSLLTNIKIPFFNNLDRRKKTTFIAACLLIIILTGGIIFVTANQKMSENKALFDSVYASANEDYEAGNDLLSLNPSLAREDLIRARETLAKADGKFKEGSEEKAQIDALKEKVESALSGTASEDSLGIKEVKDEEAPTLSAMRKDSKIVAVTEYEDNSYLLSQTSITKIDGKSGDNDILVKNDSTWSAGKSTGVFGNNLYILDKDSILKLVPTGSTYESSNYLKDKTDLAEAVSMTIDSSIYVLFKDGAITKLTKGTKDSFKISGLEDSFSSPTQIVTTEEADNLFILEPKKNRLVSLNKDGSFAKEYKAGIFKQTKAITLSTDAKTAFVLSDKKIYKLSL